MSKDQFSSFLEEMQKYFTSEFIGYAPQGYPNAGMRYKLKPKVVYHSCPICDCPHTHAHERKPRTIHAGSYLGVPVSYVTECIRYQCDICGATFFDEYDFLPWRHNITSEAENYIIWSLGTVPMSVIAGEIGVSVQTIANRATEFGRDEQTEAMKRHYKYLSMDEVFIGHNKDGSNIIYWVLNDISVPWKSNNVLLNIGRTKDEIMKQLKRLEHPQSVTAVSMDMWEAYKDAVEAILPQAVVVIDKFHVIEVAEECIKKVRLAVQCSKKEKDAMKKDATLFSTSMYKLSADELVRLDGYLQIDSRLETVYFLVQELIDFYHCHDYETALDYLCNWETEVNQTGLDLPLYTTVCNWLPYIMNYFKFRITNGKMEGRNDLIREIDRMGFHYGLPCLQGCLYAHDRRQEYIKWQNHLRDLEIAADEKKLGDSIQIQINQSIAA